MASTTSGALIRKTEPHQKVSSSQPPTSGPSGMPSALAVTQTVSARGRSSWSKSTVSTAEVSGISTAAPRPRATRAATS
jgi:hypothetical protein